MDEPTARDHLAAMVAAESEPALDDDELDMLVDLARRADSDGRAPDDDDWSPTWDLNAAAAEGWRRKAAKVAGEFGFAADGQTFQRHQAHAMCLAMEERYRRRVAGSVTTTSTAACGSW